MTVATRIIESPVGRLELVASEEGLRSLHWTSSKRTAKSSATHPVLDAAQAQLAEYSAGTRTSFDLPLDLVGTPFQVKAWRALADIPYGETVSYGEQAERIGHPKAFRAVGSANGKNPVAIILPCHRVINSDGGLGGFGGGDGLPTKRRLLDLEAGETSLLDG
jgi:methylated-DNA-[protein]-cysteine S-methyltransferase